MSTQRETDGTDVQGSPADVDGPAVDGSNMTNLLSLYRLHLLKKRIKKLTNIHKENIHGSFR